MGIYKDFFADFFADKANRWMTGIFLVAAYLVLINLGHAPLWHDEGAMAMTARNLLRSGGFNAWDGRTLYLGNDGLAADANMRIGAYAPWSALPSALGIALFGANELGVRFFHSIIGLLSLPLFWLLLKLDFPRRAPLRVLAFALFALSTQTLLFMRVGRYVADAFFFSLLLIYAYRLYMTAQGTAQGKARHLVLAAAAALLGFLNHYAIGGAMALALGVWHLLYCAKSTTRRQWVALVTAAAVVGALSFLYLLSAGVVFGDTDSLEFVFQYKIPPVLRKMILIHQNFREVIKFGWLPLWVFLWFLFFAGVFLVKKRRLSRARAQQESAAATTSDAPAATSADSADDYIAQLIKWSVLWSLFLIFSGILSVRSPAAHHFTDSRYIAPVLAYTALICAAFVMWLTQKGRLGQCAAAAAFATLLLSNALATPYLHEHYFTKKTARLLLPQFILSVHRPFHNYTNELLDYLNEHAQQDDTILVSRWQDYVVLQFYLSDKLIFCCALSEHTTLPEDKVRQYGVPAYEGDVMPDWQVLLGGASHRHNDGITYIPVEKLPGYAHVYTTERYAYPTHRPELEHHLFTPLQSKEYLAKIFRKTPQAQ